MLEVVSKRLVQKQICIKMTVSHPIPACCPTLCVNAKICFLSFSSAANLLTVLQHPVYHCHHHYDIIVIILIVIITIYFGVAWPKILDTTVLCTGISFNISIDNPFCSFFFPWVLIYHQHFMAKPCILV